jgi:putative aldouronate transport system permease protein
MSAQGTAAVAMAPEPSSRLRRGWQKFVKYLPLYVLLLPGIAYFLTFRYWPIYGLSMAFVDFQIFEGILGSPWVGLKHFESILGSPLFMRSIRNTLVISVLRLVVGFPAPIILALMLNELRFSGLKRIIQTITYLPYFLSWVIIYGILLAFLSPSAGLVNQWLGSMGASTIPFLTDKNWFLAVIIGSGVWQGAGWGAIIYLAALSNISPELYEAATIDGANRLQQIWHISIPGISSTIVLLLILNLGYLLDAGFGQIYIMYNPMVYETADIIDTWTFRNGIEQFRFSIGTAASFFKSLVGLVLVLTANKLAKHYTDSGIW